MIYLYVGLLLGGVACFALALIAQWRIARRLRRGHPQQWQIIAQPEDGTATRLQTWARLQRALRSPILPALEDRTITTWRRLWRYGPWLGWICWLAAVGMRWLLA